MARQYPLVKFGPGAVFVTLDPKLATVALTPKTAAQLSKELQWACVEALRTENIELK